MKKICCGLFLSLILILACNSNENKIPDVSNLKVQKVEISRFEKDFFELDTLNFQSAFDKLKIKYPEFLSLYLFEIQGIASPSDSDLILSDKIKSFIYNPDIRKVYNQAQIEYADLSGISEDFETAFQYLKYYLPNLPQPQLFSYVAPFQHQALTIGNDKLGIGLDMHLGKDYEFYASAGHPQYLSKTFTKEHLLANSFMAYAKSLIVENRNKNRLIDKMIYQGKLLYLVEQLLPLYDKKLFIGYTSEQLSWCERNEIQIWSFWIEQQLLYETKSVKYGRFVSPSPTTAGMPTESPGNIGSWSGWQIVKAFMKNNPDTTMAELLAIEDGQQILKLSGYKPK